MTRNRFINDPTFNTLQADLYDSSKAEVLGRIQTSALVDWETNNNWSWDDGHYLVIVWPVELPDHVNICPYGDYYDAFESSFAQGDVQVFETMVNPLDLRDGTSRDVVSQNMEVVLNVRHAYDIDVEDIEELLRFRIFMVPKTWKDDYGDWISKTAKEVSECLDAMLDEKAKVDSSLRMRPSKVALPAASDVVADAPPKKNNWKKKWNKNKNSKKKLSKEQWKKKQERIKKRREQNQA